MRKALQALIELLREREEYLPNDFADLFYQRPINKLIEQAQVELAKAESKWLIWNFERNQFWKPFNRSYTSDSEKAGRYSFEEALQIVTDANRFCRDTCNEAMMPDYRRNG